MYRRYFPTKSEIKPLSLPVISAELITLTHWLFHSIRAMTMNMCFFSPNHGLVDFPHSPALFSAWHRLVMSPQPNFHVLTFSWAAVNNRAVGQQPLSQATVERQQILNDLKRKTPLLTDSSWIRQRSAGPAKQADLPPMRRLKKKKKHLDFESRCWKCLD